MKNILILFTLSFFILFVANEDKREVSLVKEEVKSDSLSIAESEISLFKIPTTYYKKYVMLGEDLENSIPIVSATKVSDLALQQAKISCTVITKTLPLAVLNMLRKQRIYIVVFANEEYPDALPGWPSNLNAKRYAGGYGPNKPGATCGIHEGDILNNSFDRYPTENIVIHEFGHAVKNFGLEKMYPDFKAKVDDLWQNAKNAGLWNNTYAISNADEYWAEGIQTYFNLNAKGPVGGDGIHNEIHTREQFKAYDPAFFRLIDQLYGGINMPSSIK